MSTLISRHLKFSRAISRPRVTAMSISEQDDFIGVIDTRLLRGVLRGHEPMRKHVSWRAGGVADYFYLPADLQDLVLFLRHLP